jgi:hypothetical protein
MEICGLATDDRSMNAGHSLALVLPTLAAGALMLYAGLGKKRLVWRPPGTCRRCGRRLESCSCPARRR